MIPKVIHGIWLGGNMPVLQRRCVASWYQYAPDFEIKIWTESSIPNDPLVEKLIAKRQFAFASDLIRLKLLLNYGGIYLDTDVELVRSFTIPRDCTSFVSRESDSSINNAVSGGEIGAEFFKECFDVTYQSFLRGRIIYSPEAVAETLNKRDFDGLRVLDKEVFFPYNPYCDEKKQFIFSDVTSNTIGVHHFAKTWKLSYVERLFRFVRRKVL